LERPEPSPDAFNNPFLVTVSGYENDRHAAQLAEHSRGLDAASTLGAEQKT
jgi:hypothetical protein